MDGTLLDSRIPVERHWRRWATPRGLDADTILRVAHGRRSRETIAEFLPAREIDAAVAEIDALELADQEGTVAIPGALDLLARLPSHAWAVVTSASRQLAGFRLAATGLAPPGTMVTSDEVTRGKPDPEGFLLAARLLGVEAAGCVVFEDAPPGIAAGLAAGARVIALPTTQPRDRLAGAVAIIEDYRAVRITPDGGGWKVEIP